MWVLRVSVLVTVLNIQFSTGENISTGKSATQVSTHYHGDSPPFHTYPPWRALDNSNIGSLTQRETQAWWVVDLMGFYTIYNITITAWNNGNAKYAQRAVVEVTEKNILLCPETPVTWCGDIHDTVGAGEKFTFNCDPSFPVRYVRISRGPNVQLGLGHVEVHGHGRDKTNRSYYVKTEDKKVSQILQTVGAVMAAECGILCHQRHDCLHFSYSKTAPSAANCLLTNQPEPQTTVETGWVLHTLDECY